MTKSISGVLVAQRIILGVYVSTICWLFYRNWASVPDLLGYGWFHFSLLISLYVLGIGAQAFSFGLLFEREDRRKLSGLLGFWGWSTLLGYVAPFAPAVLIRATWFYKRRIEVSTYARKTLFWLLGSLLVACSLAGAAFFSHLFQSFLGLICFPLLLICLKRLLNFIRGLLPTYRASWLLSEGNAALSFPSNFVISWLSVQYVVTALCYVVALDAVGLELRLFEGILISTLMIVSTVIPIFPNGVGLVEVVIGGVVVAKGFAEIDVVAVLVQLRLAHIFAALAVGIIGCSVSRFSRGQFEVDGQ